MSNQSQTRGSALPPNQLAGISAERHGPIVVISLLSAAAAMAETSQLNRESFKVLFSSQCYRPFLLSMHLCFIETFESKHETRAACAGTAADKWQELCRDVFYCGFPRRPASIQTSLAASIHSRIFIFSPLRVMHGRNHISFSAPLQNRFKKPVHREGRVFSDEKKSKSRDASCQDDKACFVSCGFFFL